MDNDFVVKKRFGDHWDAKEVRFTGEPEKDFAECNVTITMGNKQMVVPGRALMEFAAEYVRQRKLYRLRVASMLTVFGID